MRKILFRGQRISDNSWVCGNLIFRNHPNADEAIPAIHLSNENTDIFVEGSTVGQFTGAWDKLGKPIFEGDIVMYDSGRMCAVIWFESPEYCGFDLHAINNEEGVAPARVWDESKIRVIGNVHEKNTSTHKDNPVIRCRDCEFYYLGIDEKIEDLPEYADRVCSYNMSDGYTPGDGCTHGRPREKRGNAHESHQQG